MRPDQQVQLTGDKNALHAQHARRRYTWVREQILKDKAIAFLIYYYLAKSLFEGVD